MFYLVLKKIQEIEIVTLVVVEDITILIRITQPTGMNQNATPGMFLTRKFYNMKHSKKKQKILHASLEFFLAGSYH